jgi:hypothetical protein
VPQQDEEQQKVQKSTDTVEQEQQTLPPQQEQVDGTFGPGPTGIKDINPKPTVAPTANLEVSPAIQQPVAVPAQQTKTMPSAPQPSQNAPRFHLNPHQVVPQSKKRDDEKARETARR